jgi:pimeloyl-ACP methyl ester carboxylesterase
MSSSKPMATPVLLIRGLGGTSNVWFAQRRRSRPELPGHLPVDTPQDICQHLAADHCDKVKSLALLGLLVEPPEPARKALRDRAAAVHESGMAAMADTMLPLSTSAETRASRLAAATVWELLMRQSAQGYTKTGEALAAARAAKLERIKGPTILISGDEDGGGGETPGGEDSGGQRRRCLPAPDTGRRLSARARSTRRCSLSISAEVL